MSQSTTKGDDGEPLRWYTRMIRAKGADDPKTSGAAWNQDDPEDLLPHDLMMEELRDAAADYHRQQARCKRAYALVNVQLDRDPSIPYEEMLAWEKWASIIQGSRHKAERRLIRIILAAVGRIDCTGDPAWQRFEESTLTERSGSQWEPVLFELDKRFYVVGQDPDNDRFSPVLHVVGIENSGADWADPPQYGTDNND